MTNLESSITSKRGKTKKVTSKALLFICLALIQNNSKLFTKAIQREGTQLEDIQKTVFKVKFEEFEILGSKSSKKTLRILPGSAVPAPSGIDKKDPKGSSKEPKKKVFRGKVIYTKHISEKRGEVRVYVYKKQTFPYGGFSVTNTKDHIDPFLESANGKQRDDMKLEVFEHESWPTEMHSNIKVSFTWTEPPEPETKKSESEKKKLTRKQRRMTRLQWIVSTLKIDFIQNKGDVTANAPETSSKENNDKKKPGDDIVDLKVVDSRDFSRWAYIFVFVTLIILQVLLYTISLFIGLNMKEYDDANRANLLYPLSYGRLTSNGDVLITNSTKFSGLGFLIVLVVFAASVRLVSIYFHSLELYMLIMMFVIHCCFLMGPFLRYIGINITNLIFWIVLVIVGICSYLLVYRTDFLAYIPYLVASINFITIFDALRVSDPCGLWLSWVLYALPFQLTYYVVYYSGFSFYSLPSDLKNGLIFIALVVVSDILLLLVEKLDLGKKFFQMKVKAGDPKAELGSFF